MVVPGYGVVVFVPGTALKSLALGIACAIRSGLGIVLISGIGCVVFGQRFDLPGLPGLLGFKHQVQRLI